MKKILLCTTGFILLHSSNSTLFPNMLGGGGFLGGMVGGLQGGGRRTSGCRTRQDGSSRDGTRRGQFGRQGRYNRINNFGERQLPIENQSQRQQIRNNNQRRQQPRQPFISPDVGQLFQDGNLIQNGNFGFPRLRNRYEFVNSLPGWQANEIERGIGSLYNTRWGDNVIVVELDGNQNNSLRQTVQLKKGRYRLSFKWAARSENVGSSAMLVLWNKRRLFEVTASNEQIRSQDIPINVSSDGSYQIQFNGKGNSDTYGMTISNIRLTRDSYQPILTPIPIPTQTTTAKPVIQPKPVDNIIQNQSINQNIDVNQSGFRQVSSSSFTKIINQRTIQTPFWNLRGLKIVPSAEFNPLIKDVQNVLVSSPGKASQLRQRVQLKEGTFSLVFNYVARRTNSPIDKLEVTINNKFVSSPQPISNQIKIATAKLRVLKEGYFNISIKIPASNPGIALINPRIQVTQAARSGQISTATKTSKSTTSTSTSTSGSGNKKTTTTTNQTKVNVKKPTVTKTTTTSVQMIPNQQIVDEQFIDQTIDQDQDQFDLNLPIPTSTSKTATTLTTSGSKQKTQGTTKTTTTTTNVKVNQLNNNNNNNNKRKDVQTGSGFTEEQQQEPEFVVQDSE